MSEACVVPASADQIEIHKQDSALQEDAKAKRKLRNEQRKQARLIHEANRNAKLAAATVEQRPEQDCTTGKRVKTPAKATPLADQPYHQQLVHKMVHGLIKESSRHMTADAHFNLASSIASTTAITTKSAIVTSTAVDITDSCRTSRESDAVPPYEQVPTRLASTAFPSIRRRRSKTLPKPSHAPHVFTLDAVAGAAALESLIERYGLTSHGGTMDKSYSFFMTRAKDAALSFKVHDGVAVLGGDPICDPSLYSKVFAEFKEYRKQHGWGITVFSASTGMLNYASEHKWATIRFGTERVLNPMTNPVLHEKVQKQIIRQNKQLLDPAKGGLTLEAYNPNLFRDFALEEQLVGVYEAWRNERNHSGQPQTHSTVYELFAWPRLMIYIYTRDRDGKPNGLAALRKMSAKNGYYLDPCIAAPGAPRRIPDLLHFAAMALLNAMGVSYMSVGMEPSESLELTGFPSTMTKYATHIHDKLFHNLKLSGKKEYHDKFRPDEALETGLYLMFPSGVPGPRHILSIVHLVNIQVRRLIYSKLRMKKSKAQESIPASAQAQEADS